MKYRLLWALFFLAHVSCAFAQFADQRQFVGTSGGSANAQTVLIPNYNLNIGVVIRFTPAFTNTGAMTLNVNSSGVVAIEKLSVSGLVALTGGEVVQNAVAEVIFDGAQYELLNSPTATGAINTTAALQALNPVGLAVGTTVAKVGYYVAGDMPQVRYFLLAAVCDQNAGAGDGGSEIPSNTAGYCWHITPQTAWDPAWWGAKGDVVSFTQVLTATSGNPNITIAGQSCLNTIYGDGTARIVFTDVTSATGLTAAGATYAGTITSCSGTSFVVNPAPTFNSATPIAQYGSYGHLDDTALNNWSTYVGTLPTNGADYVLASMAGRSYGLSGPLTTNGGVNYNSGTLNALAVGTFTATNGLFYIPASTTNVTVNHMYWNAAFLPVQCYYDVPNGVTTVTESSCRHWYGSISSGTATLSGASGAYTLTTANTANLAVMMVSRGNPNISDRSVIVGIVANTSITLNKPITGTITTAVETFYTDPAGLTLSGTNSGAHFINVTSQQFDASDSEHQNGSDNYGAALSVAPQGGASSGGNQSDFLRFYASGGVATVECSTTCSGLDMLFSHVFNTYYKGDVSPEANPPAYLIASGGSDINIIGGDFTGVLQYFILSAAAPSISMVNFKANAPTQISLGGLNNNFVQFYTNQTNVNTGIVRLDPNPNMAGGNHAYSFGGIGSCGSAYSYASFTCQQAINIAGLSGGVLIPSRPPLATPGINLLSGDLTSTNLLCGGGAPTISSGFGTSPSITAQNGSCAFQVNVGTGGVANSGVILFPTAAANGWACHAEDVTSQSPTIFLTRQVSVTTLRATLQNFDATGAVQPWAASDSLLVGCTAY